MTTLELLSTPGMSGSKKMMDLYNASQKRMDRNIQTQMNAMALINLISSMKRKGKSC